MQCQSKILNHNVLNLFLFPVILEHKINPNRRVVSDANDRQNGVNPNIWKTMEPIENLNLPSRSNRLREQKVHY